MAKKLLHSWIGAHTRVHMHFFAESRHAFTCVVAHHACAGVYVRQMLWTSAYNLLHALYRMCICDRCRDTYIYMCIGICIYIYVYVHECAYVFVYVSMYECMSMCMYIYTYICVCMYACVCVYAYVYMCMHIYKSIYISAESLHAFTGIVEHHACTGVCVRQMLWASISVHICFTLATGCAYALYIYMYLCIYVCVDVYECMYIYLYVCMPLHVYAYMHGCIYMCMCMCMCKCIYVYVYVCVYIYICISISPVCAVCFI